MQRKVDGLVHALPPLQEWELDCYSSFRDRKIGLYEGKENRGDFFGHWVGWKGFFNVNNVLLVHLPHNMSFWILFSSTLSIHLV
jgi:hypothetical protein